MRTDPMSTVFPPSARAMQEKLGSRAAIARHASFPHELSEDLITFIAHANSFYIATATADAKPYVQHRGGPRGFLKVLGATTLGFADFSGNRQYITLGRLSENDACCLFLMDYVHQRRVKLWGRARIIEDDENLVVRLAEPRYRARVERAIVIEVDAWSVNCRQHIPQLVDAEDVARTVQEFTARIEALETEISRLRAGSGAINDIKSH